MVTETKCGEGMAGTERTYYKCSENIKSLICTKDEYSLLNEKIVTQEDIEKNKIVSLFSYLSILVLVPLFLAKNSKFASFHINQGINLLILEVIYVIISCLINLIILSKYSFEILNGLIPIFIIFINMTLGIFITFSSAIGIINVVTGKMKRLPIVGNFKILK